MAARCLDIFQYLQYNKLSSIICKNKMSSFILNWKNDFNYWTWHVGQDDNLLEIKTWSSSISRDGATRRPRKNS